MSRTMPARPVTQRALKRIIATGFGVVAACTPAGLVSAPARAADARCQAYQVGVDCGSIYNTSGVSIRIATNFSATYSADVGTASGVTATLYAGQNSNIFKDSSGRFYDWDAVYVGSRSCLSMNVGPGMSSPVYYNNTRTFGVWYKVNNFGANVRNLRAC